MNNYTTQTASLKATTVDTRLLDAKQIDTKKLFIDGKEFTWKDNLKHLHFIIDVTQETSGKFVVSSTQIVDLLTNEKNEGAAGFVQGSKISIVAGNDIDLLDDGWWLMLPKIESLSVSQIYINNGLPRKVILPVLEQGASIFFIKIAEETDTITELYNKTDTIKFEIICDRYA